MGMFANLSRYAAKSATSSKGYVVKREFDGEGTITFKMAVRPDVHTDDALLAAAAAGGFTAGTAAEATKRGGFKGGDKGLAVPAAAAANIFRAIIDGTPVADDEPAGDPAEGGVNRVADHVGRNGRKAK